MAKKFFFLIAIISTFLAIVGGIIFWVVKSFSARTTTPNYQSFIIPKGYGASQIASKLEKEGFIKSALAFKVYTQVTGISKRLFAGEYRISPHLNLVEVLKELTGAPLEVWVTANEGLRREEILEKFVEGLGKKDEAAVAFRSEFMESTADLEGFLFPDTYLFPKEASASAIVAKLKGTFDKKIAQEDEKIKASKLSLNQIVTLASILERETRTDEERPIVAGILLNRFEIGMPLQADATVQYAKANVNCKLKTENCDWWPRPILREDLEINSPYNTYKFNGLPPGPIAAPGNSALNAAISPEDSDYFYYIHEDDGTVHYAKTLDEHNANVRKYLGK